MAVVKMTQTKNGVGFIDDEGNYFVTSVVFLRKMLAGELTSDIIVLKRLPNKVDVSRFKKSPVWDPAKPLPTVEELKLQGRQDMLDAQKKIEEIKPIEDKKVQW